MKKGQKKRIWTKEDKLKIVKRYSTEHISAKELGRIYEADYSMICRWIREYAAEGDKAFEKRKSGNKYASLHTSKNLSEIERLKLEIAKLRVENERLKKRVYDERSWCKKGIRYYKRCEYEIIYRLKNKYSIKYLCELMSVNRSGYYKWLARKDKPNRYEQDRILLTNLLLEEHKKHKSKGYHYLAHVIRNNTGWIFSDNLAHKCCKYAGIRSKTKRGYRASKGEENIKFPNKIKGEWTATKPLEIVVSDMTCIFHKGIRWEWTYILDTYNNEIIASAVTKTRNSNIPYYKCLKQLLERVKEQSYPVILHTDQGSVYSSTGFYLAHKDYTTIERSMSRVGTPTDNPIIESINGWIKEELKYDFDLKNVKSFPQFIENYVYYFNNERLSSKLNYKTPVQFRIEQGF